MAGRNSTDNLKGRRVKKGLPKTKPTAKERARAEKVQDKPKARGTRASSTPASRPGRISNTGKMDGASGTRNATDKGQTTKKINNSKAAGTKRKLKANRVKQDNAPKNKGSAKPTTPKKTKINSKPKAKVPSKLAGMAKAVGRRAMGVAGVGLSVVEEHKKAEAAARRKARLKGSPDRI